MNERVISKKEDIGFTQIRNTVLNDPELSWDAKGMFAYLYSKPEGWDFSCHRIKDDGKSSVNKVNNILKELESKELLKRVRLPSGRVEYELSYSKLVASSPDHQINDLGIVSNTNIYIDTNNTPIPIHSNTYIKEKDSELKKNFDKFRKLYKEVGGITRGLDTEFGEFKKKHKDYKEVIPKLVDALEREYLDKKKKIEKNEFAPGWKHLKTYLNQRSWEVYED